jgi:hypothetical protein
MKIGLARLIGRRGPDPEKWRGPPGLADWIQYAAIGLILGAAPYLFKLLG